MPHLVVIYGAPLVGKSAVAREVASSMKGKTALVSVDALLEDSIVVPDVDAYAELEMVHTQARLLVANYLKNRYNVVIEGAFYYERDGVLERHEQEIDQLVSLMRNLAPAPLLVRLSAPAERLRQRGEAIGRSAEVDVAGRIDAAYKARYGDRAVQLETGEQDVAGTAAEVLRRLEGEEFA